MAQTLQKIPIKEQADLLRLVLKILRLAFYLKVGCFFSNVVTMG